MRLDIFLLLLSAAASAPTATAQDEIGCFVPGECLRSIYARFSDQPTVQYCHLFCRGVIDCNFFTHFADSEACFAFVNCVEFSTSTCSDCVSGEAVCPELQCFMPGRCEGTLVDFASGVASADSCLQLCKATPLCDWWSFDSADRICIMTEDCPFQEACDTCTFGQQECGSTGPAPTEQTTAPTTVQPTPEPTTTPEPEPTTTEPAATTLPPLPMLTALTLDAQTGVPLPLVPLRFGVLPTVSEGATDAAGTLVMGVFAAGELVSISASKEGYLDFATVYEVTSAPQQTVPIAMSPILEHNETVRAVLSWGPLPLDLDLHNLQIGRGNGSILCEVFYSHKNCNDVNLDVDNTDGGDKGPETLTWTQPHDFTHAVFVYDYQPSSSVSLAESGAKVTFYGKGAAEEDVVIEVEVPTDDPNTASRWWVVGCFDGRVGISSLVVRNYLSNQNQSNNREICEGIFKDS